MSRIKIKETDEWSLDVIISNNEKYACNSFIFNIQPVSENKNFYFPTLRIHDIKTFKKLLKFMNKELEKIEEKELRKKIQKNNRPLKLDGEKW